jgi:hypothetical protein
MLGSRSYINLSSCFDRGLGNVAFERLVERGFANLKAAGAASRIDRPAAIWVRALRSLSGVMTGRRPPSLPRSRAAFKPVSVRSLIKSRRRGGVDLLGERPEVNASCGGFLDLLD